jgi:hypothetical protein
VYKYKFRWKSGSGYTGIFSAVRTTASLTSDIVTVSYASRPQLDITKVEIYRTAAGGSTFSLLAEDDVTDSGFSYVDNGSVALTTAEDYADSYHNAPTPGLRHLTMINGFIYAWMGGLKRHWVARSNYGEYEYWPTFVLADPSATIETMGCQFQVGANVSDAGGRIVVEGGTYNQTGIVGEEILLWHRYGFHRLYGIDYSELQLKQCGSEPLFATASVVNCGDVTIGLSARGVVGIVRGANDGVLLSNGIYPYGMVERMRNLRDSALYPDLPWSAVRWNGFYVLTQQSETSDPSTYSSLYFMHIDSKTWMRLHGPYCGVAVSLDGTLYCGSYKNGLVANVCAGADGFNASAGVGNGNYSKTLTLTTATMPGFTLDNLPVQMTTPPLYLGDIHHEKKALKIMACVRVAREAQSVSGYLYANGDTTTAVAALSSQTLTTDTSGVKRQFLSWTNLDKRAMFFQIALLATVNRQISIEWIKLDYETGAEVRKAI